MGSPMSHGRLARAPPKDEVDRKTPDRDQGAQTSPYVWTTPTRLHAVNLVKVKQRQIPGHVSALNPDILLSQERLASNTLASARLFSTTGVSHAQHAASEYVSDTLGQGGA